MQQLELCGTRAAQFGVGLGELRVGAVRVELQQQLTRGHAIAFPHRNGDHRFGGLGLDGDAVPFQRAEQRWRIPAAAAAGRGQKGEQ
ncbi:MAG: hypothetical protein AMXMBFR59_31080 [Rhodanobacteraceae bacterium]